MLLFPLNLALKTARHLFKRKRIQFACLPLVVFSLIGSVSLGSVIDRGALRAGSGGLGQVWWVRD